VTRRDSDSGTNRYREAERTLWSQYGLSPKEYFIQVGSPPVRIRVIEVGSGAPLLFAHGTAGSGPAFASLIHRLPGFRCIVFDRPGLRARSETRKVGACSGGPSRVRFSSANSVTSSPSIVCARSSLSNPTDVRANVGVATGLPPCEPSVSVSFTTPVVPDVVRNPQTD
jgi:hypothetical protein